MQLRRGVVGIPQPGAGSPGGDGGLGVAAAGGGGGAAHGAAHRRCRLADHGGGDGHLARASALAAALVGPADRAVRPPGAGRHLGRSAAVLVAVLRLGLPGPAAAGGRAGAPGRAAGTGRAGGVGMDDPHLPADRTGTSPGVPHPGPPGPGSGRVMTLTTVPMTVTVTVGQERTC